MAPILPPRLRDATNARKLERREAGKRTAQMEIAIPHPCSPGGGGTISGFSALMTYGSFDGSVSCRAWQSLADGIFHRGLAAELLYATDAATTGEVRLTIVTVSQGTISSGVRPLAAAANGTVEWRWLHDLDVPLIEKCHLYVEARRTGGGGNVTIACPIGGIRQVHSQGCLDDGLV